MKWVKTYESFTREGFLYEWINYREQYTDEEIATIEDYQQWSRGLNKQLATDALDDKSFQMAAKLDKIIGKNKNKSSGSLIVYRGVFNNKRYEEYLSMNGQDIVYKPFLSTSLDKNIAQGFGKNIIEINIKNGTPFVYLTNGDKFLDEKELLFPRNLMFRVIVDKNKVAFKQI
jgi:hypothetical protein